MVLRQVGDLASADWGRYYFKCAARREAEGCGAREWDESRPRDAEVPRRFRG